jgi:hypothetical protein
LPRAGPRWPTATPGNRLGLAREEFGSGPWQRGLLAARIDVAGLLAAPLHRCSAAGFKAQICWATSAAASSSACPSEPRPAEPELRY